MLSFRPISGALLLFMLFSPACIKRSRIVHTTEREANDQQPPSVRGQQNLRLININIASASELETLPGIGLGLAGRIIEHREKFGLFRRTEHLIIVRGISDRRFRAIRELVTVQ